MGGNGFLVLLQKTNSYAPNPNATLLANTDTGAGFGSGSSSSIGHRGNGGQTDLEHPSVTFMLIQTTNAPVPGADIDPDNSGVPHGTNDAGWTVLDSVGVLGAHGFGDIAYGAINFRRNTVPGNGATAPGIIVPVGFTPSYVGRFSNTVGSAAADWVASDSLGGTAPNWTLGSAANTSPARFARWTSRLPRASVTAFTGWVRTRTPTSAGRARIARASGPRTFPAQERRAR